MYFDYYYLILVVPMLILSLIAQGMVQSSFKKYSKLMGSRRITGAQAAEMLLRSQGVYNVRVERVGGNLTDHYDPKTNVIRLSDGVYSSSSVAAVGIACHEAGHALQYSESYAPIKFRMALVPVCNIASQFAIPLIILGIVLSFFELAYIGIAAFALSTVFQLVTLPVEFNASRRAMSIIKEQNMLFDEEVKGARKVLTAAAMTYVAALAVSLANLLRFVMIVGNRRD